MSARIEGKRQHRPPNTNTQQTTVNVFPNKYNHFPFQISFQKLYKKIRYLVYRISDSISLKKIEKAEHLASARPHRVSPIRSQNKLKF